MFESTPYARLDDNVLALLGTVESADLYLDRCQVDTPHALVSKVWALINERRRHAGRVVDFGSGDARFAFAGSYASYEGFEIDRSRYSSVELPFKAVIKNACAFSVDISNADVCVGNPPYVRNQDLPVGWRQSAAATIERRLGIRISGLANAWQYFFLLSLASTKCDGLVAIVIPFEWVSRPSSSALREYIKRQGWSVNVYRLSDSTFENVLTTASITIVDKGGDGQWCYFREAPDGNFQPMENPTGDALSLLPYVRGNSRDVHVKRGLSPGTQQYLVLTEAERARCGLRPGEDVVRCITSLRSTDGTALRFTMARFLQDYVHAGKKCWLIRTDRGPSVRLQAYLDSVPPAGRKSSTCANRDTWWKFNMPEVPKAFIASGFRDTPKVVINEVGALAVGSVYGIYAPSKAAGERAVRLLRAVNFAGRVVSHANGLRKLEINQINSLLAEKRGHGH